MTYEDFTTYTEVDVEADHIQKTANHIDFNAYSNEDAYVYKNAGVDHFGDFEHKITVKAISAGAGGTAHVWTLANMISDFWAIDVASGSALTAFLHYDGVDYRIWIRELYLGDIYGDGFVIDVATSYYLTIKRDGTAFTCKIYSDSARTNRLATLSLTLHASIDFRYIYGCQTFNDAVAVPLDCDIDNLDLQEEMQFEDARYRTKEWLETHLNNAALTKDDDATQVSFIVAYAKPNYSVETVFKTKQVDLIFNVDKPESKPFIDNKGTPHAYVENVPIIVECIDKSGITATKLLWKAEDELRRVAREYPEDVSRTIDFMKDETKRTEGFTVYSSTYMLRYRRPATVTGTPTITYGHGKLEECRTAYTTRGDSGDPLTTPSCVVQNGGYFRIQGTTDNEAALEYCYYQSADLTGEAKSTSVYDKWLARFRTSHSSLGLGAKIVIVYTDDSTETLYGSTPQYNTYWKTVSGTIIASKTIKYIRFYAAEDAVDNPNGTYWVEYDFLLLHRGTFTFPYMSKPLELEIENREAIHKVPGRVGVRTQYLGLDSPLIVLSGDIDDNSDWGSPLGQKMYELMFERFKDPWQWFTSNLTSCKVELVSFNIKESSEDDAKRQWVLTLRKHDEYCGSHDWVWEYFSS